MRVDVAARLLDVELRQRRVVWPRAGDQHVVDGLAQLGKKSSEPIEIGGIEGRRARTELAPDASQAISVARGEDHVCSFSASKPGSLEADARAAADHDDS